MNTNYGSKHRDSIEEASKNWPSFNWKKTNNTIIMVDRNYRQNFFFRICCCCFCNFSLKNDHDHDHDPKYHDDDHFQLKSHAKNLDRSNDPAKITTKKMISCFSFTNSRHNSNDTSSTMNLSSRMREQKSSSLKLFNRKMDLMIDHHPQQQQQQFKAHNEIKSRTRNSLMMVMLDQNNNSGSHCRHHHGVDTFNQTKSSCTMENQCFHFLLTMVI